MPKTIRDNGKWTCEECGQDKDDETFCLCD